MEFLKCFILRNASVAVVWFRMSGNSTSTLTLNTLTRIRQPLGHGISFLTGLFDSGGNHVMPEIASILKFFKSMLLFI